MKAVALDLDGVIGDTRPLWDAWLTDAARRYASIAVLDVGSLPRDRGEAAAELDRWAAQGIGDWRQAVARYAEEHAPLHLRPDPGVGAALRSLKDAGILVGVFTDAPDTLARAALAHVGALRRVDRLAGGAGALKHLLACFATDVRVVRDRRELAQLTTERSR